MFDAEQVAKSISKSNYFVAARGCRDVKFDELVLIVSVLISGGDENDLNVIYENDPETISINRFFAKSTCSNYDNAKCRCFIPGHETECWFKESRLDYRNTSEYVERRTSVFKRDNYTCVDCGAIGGSLNAHHIKPYATNKELRLVVSNGVTLCEDCHRKRHKGG